MSSRSVRRRRRRERERQARRAEEREAEAVVQALAGRRQPREVNVTILDDTALDRAVLEAIRDRLHPPMKMAYRNWPPEH